MIMAEIFQSEFITGWAEELMLDLDLHEYADIIKLGLWDGITDCGVNPKRIVLMFINGNMHEYEASLYDDITEADHMDLEGWDDMYPYEYIDYSSFGGILDLTAYGPQTSRTSTHLHARNGHSPVEEFEKPPLFEESWYRRMCTGEDVCIPTFEMRADYGFETYIKEFETQRDETEAPVCQG